MEPNGNPDPSRRISKLYEAHPGPLETFLTNLAHLKWPNFLTPPPPSVELRIKRRDKASVAPVTTPVETEPSDAVCYGAPVDHSARSPRSFLSESTRIPSEPDYLSMQAV